MQARPDLHSRLNVLGIEDNSKTRCFYTIDGRKLLLSSRWAILYRALNPILLLGFLHFAKDAHDKASSHYLN